MFISSASNNLGTSTYPVSWYCATSDGENFVADIDEFSDWTVDVGGQQ
jgi:hypothetical protein